MSEAFGSKRTGSSNATPVRPSVEEEEDLEKEDGAVVTSKRITLVMPPASHKRLKELKHETGVPTIVELISRALRVLEWMVSARRRGAVILLREPGEDAKVVEFVW